MVSLSERGKGKGRRKQRMEKSSGKGEIERAYRQKLKDKERGSARKSEGDRERREIGLVSHAPAHAS